MVSKGYTVGAGPDASQHVEIAARAMAELPHPTLDEVKGLALTRGRLVFRGQVAHARGRARPSIRELGPAP